MCCMDDDPIDVAAVRVLHAENIKGCGISVEFTDGTSAHYPPEELASLRPYRKPSHDDPYLPM